MELTRPGDADAFLARAGAFLLERESEHNLLLGLAARLRRNPRSFGDDPYFAVVEDGGRVVGAALRTPPHNLLLSELDDPAALEPIVDDVRAAFGALPGLLGPTAAAAAFARRWQAETGARGRVAVAERIYRASRVDPPAGVPGTRRLYRPEDRPLVLAWLEAFVAEVMHHGVVEEMAALLDHRLGEPDGGFVLWEDGGAAVSVAGFGSPTPNGIRVGPVYTPPEQRGRGYASALTAALTGDLLAGGRRFCFLFTDLANPTSNSIYRKVGYEPVADVDQWSFASNE